MSIRLFRDEARCFCILRDLVAFKTLFLIFLGYLGLAGFKLLRLGLIISP